MMAGRGIAMHDPPLAIVCVLRHRHQAPEPSVVSPTKHVTVSLYRKVSRTPGAAQVPNQSHGLPASLDPALLSKLRLLVSAVSPIAIMDHGGMKNLSSKVSSGTSQYV